jgi:hypothetical protein
LRSREARSTWPSSAADKTCWPFLDALRRSVFCGSRLERT